MSLNQSWREKHNNEPKDANSLRRKPQWHVFTGSTEDRKSEKQKIIEMCVFVLKIFGQTWWFFASLFPAPCASGSRSFCARNPSEPHEVCVEFEREGLMLIIWQSNHRDMTTSPKASFMTYVRHLGRFLSGIVEDGLTETLGPSARGLRLSLAYQQTLMWSFYNANCLSCGRGLYPKSTHQNHLCFFTHYKLCSSSRAQA